MRIGAACLLVLALYPGRVFPSPDGPGGADDSGREHFPRGPYLLRQIFGDLPRSAPEVGGVVPGIRREEVPAGADLGAQEERSAGSPLAFTRDVSGRATVTFVFGDGGAAARLDHITVTLMQAPNITLKAVATHLTKIYGPADPLPPGQTVGSWQKGAILLRSFPAAHFFEVTLSSSPHAPSPKDP